MLETAIEEVLKTDKITKKTFLGVFARNELPVDPTYPSCFVFNTSPRTLPGSHLLCIFYDLNGNSFFFDSYGMHPQNFGMVEYLNNTSNSWCYNKKRLQGNSQYCGHFCVFFLLFKTRQKSKNFFLCFSKNLTKNDLIIKRLMSNF